MTVTVIHFLVTATSIIVVGVISVGDNASVLVVTTVVVTILVLDMVERYTVQQGEVAVVWMALLLVLLCS